MTGNKWLRFLLERVPPDALPPDVGAVSGFVDYLQRKAAEEQLATTATPTLARQAVPTPVPPVPAPAPEPVITVTPTSTPVPPPSVNMPVPAPTPTPSHAPNSQSVPGGQMDPLELVVRALRAVRPAGYMRSPQNWGNDALGTGLGLLGSGQIRFDAEGNLLFENVRGPVATGLKRINNTNDPVAMTLGHVILSTDPIDESVERGAKWLAHESAHVRQSELLGPSYIPAYVLLWLLSGRDHDTHPMEQQASAYQGRYWPEYLRPAMRQP